MLTPCRLFDFWELSLVAFRLEEPSTGQNSKSTFSGATGVVSFFQLLPFRRGLVIDVGLGRHDGRAFGPEPGLTAQQHTAAKLTAGRHASTHQRQLGEQRSDVVRGALLSFVLQRSSRITHVGRGAAQSCSSNFHTLKLSAR